MQKEGFSDSLKWFLVLFFLNSCVCQGLNCNDCCNNYKEINEPRRSINSIWKQGQTPLCDRLIPFGWYRFTSFNGTRMPETPVTEFHCGTHDPVWLKDPHPTVAEGNMARTACISSFGDDCSHSVTINVTKCAGDYFVYYLRPLYYCATAYCAGFGVPCPYGKVGEHPNCYDPPATFSNDNLGFPEINYVAKEEHVSVTLVCKVAILNGIEKWKNVTYSIEWFAEGKTLKNETICGGLLPGKVNKKPCPDANLTSSRLPGENYTIGQSISCQVSAKFTTSPENVWSSPKQVLQPFFAGLKVHPTALNLNAFDPPQTITITPTIPVRKAKPRGLPNITFYTPREVTILEGCEIQLQEGVQSVEIKVKALSGQQVSAGLKAIIPKIYYRNSLFWNHNVGLPTIWVHIKAKKEIEQCKSTGDPHFLTLEPLNFGPRFTFHEKGDFILYKNPERHFEVHTRHWTCWLSATCNCGVVVRDHNDVIEFNCCNEFLEHAISTPLRVKIRSGKCLSPGISINNVMPGGHVSYEVLFPSGTKVGIDRFSWGLDVRLYTPRANVPTQESGLCLFPQAGQDYRTYGENLRLLHDQSYFDVLPPRVDDKQVAYSVACLCNKSETEGPTECQNAFHYAFPTVKKEKLSPMFLCDRQKRDIQFSDDPTDEDFVLFKRTAAVRIRGRREAEKFSKENATYYCAKRISETKVGKLCAKVGVDLQALVDVCSMDVEYTGDYSYVSGGVVALTDQCGNLAALDLSRAANSTNSSSGDADGSAGSALVEEITESLCPNDCSFNGKCVNGSCLCYKDFIADDCSANLYEIPSIQSLQTNGLCDRRTRPCRKVTVLGTSFIPTENLTCHVREFKVVNSTWQPYNTELKLPGVMTDLVLADCNLPESPVSPGYFHEVDEGTPAAGLVISVSNDGEHKSDQNLTFISYDSACMGCNISSGCSLKGNSCFINGYCFAANESNPIDFCSQCLPDVNTSTWTKRRVNFPPKFSSINQFYALYEENMQLAIIVSDPEGMPVTVTLMDGSPVQAVIRDNVLVWNASSSPRTQFMLKATDACQAVSTYNITISLVVCQCQNNGSCIPHPNSPRGSGLYQCNCAPGFTGDACQTDIDECLSYPCLRGRCIDEINDFSCICDPGYVGRTCDTDYDDCSSSPCVHGNCIDYTGSYGCTCEPGYAGENCEININECVSSPCRHGTCVDQVNNYICQCHAGYTGYDCNIEIDECQSSPCVHGTCYDKVNGFTCSCEAGFSGMRCDMNVDECLSFPCVNGICLDLVNNYTCSCNVGYTGRDCDVVIKTCTEDSCFPNVTCFKSGPTISCGPCPFGFTGDGKNCRDINDCANHTCANGASCVDGINSYSCNCTTGFTGPYCKTDMDDCANHTCANGASCVDGVNTYFCNCTAGFTGPYCETDIDDCTNHICANGASCIDGINSYSCNCTAGFTGPRCKTDIDDCVNQTCNNGASCVDGINTYSCNCAAGFTGAHCETDLDECANHTCANGASCMDGINSYSCNCTAGFTGVFCETDIDNCVNHACANGASCVDAINSYWCNCTVGFTGAYCETEKLPSTRSDLTSIAVLSQEKKSMFATTALNLPITPSSSALASVSTRITPSTPSPEIEYTFSIKILDDWTNDLQDKDSDAFQQLSFQLETEIKKKLSGTRGFIGVNVLSFRKGSIVAEFQLIFNRNVQPKEAFDMMKETINDGNLGSLRVDPASLKQISVETEEPEDKELPYAIIIGASFAGLFVLVLGGIFFYRFHKNRKTGEHKIRNSDDLPPDEAFPNLEKYEMHKAGMSNKGFQ
ncbi:von Willebrand factor D and EGF domain-containing protein-like isoform X2 [Montipora foliosa]|uniref:von Willebrand factor D and EGF domain-containing protein-like isoform X2 n=1 Tax=Montipora foliosa TaxID=591990 RepID=UPI0035F1F55C